MPRMRALAKFLLVDDVRVAPAHLGQEERESRAGDTAPEEDCNDMSAHPSVTNHHNEEKTTRRHEKTGRRGDADGEVKKGCGTHSRARRACRCPWTGC